MEYAIRQSAAIVREGVEVHFLCKASFPVERLGAGIVIEKFEESRVASVQRRGVAEKISTIWRLTFGQRRTAKRVCEVFGRGGFDAVLFACFKEYFAPFWVGPLQGLARRGAVIGTIAHDPVRDFVVGPLWWHRWSVRLGYSFVRHVFVHDDTPVDFGGRRPEAIEVHQIPHGPYELAEPKIGRIEMRRRLRFSSDLTTIERQGGREKEQPKVGSKGEEAGATESKHTEGTEEDCKRLGEGVVHKSSGGEGGEQRGAGSLERGVSCAGAKPELPVCEQGLDAGRSSLDTSAPADVVFLAFGQIRDGKNLDLFLRAMVQLPENVKLLVAGKGDSGSSRPPEFYQRLAGELGVANRCRWDLRKIPDGEVGGIFAACDVVLATYGANFRSASGVLNAAVSARKPVLASSGPGPLKSAVVKYGLGVFVEPDDVGAMVKGVVEILEVGPSPEWGIYEKENSWLENASKIRKHLNLE